MIRKFNYTGRRKLKSSRVSISLMEGDPFRSFSVNLNLDDLTIPKEAKIYIEPYFKSSYMRFPFGSVENQEKPRDTYLKDIPRTELVRFRVKIVDESKLFGRILRVADRIKPQNQTENGRNSILWINWDQDLDQQIFRVSFKTDFPSLEINRSIVRGKELLKDDILFRSLVFPSVVKEIATRIVLDKNEFEEGDDSWQSAWLRYIKERLHVIIDTNFEARGEDENEYWVEEVVAAFCRLQRAKDKFELTLNSRV